MTRRAYAGRAAQTSANGTGPAHAYGPDVLPQHAAQLVASGISPATAQARGYRSVTTVAELEAFAPSQRRVPGLLLPVWTVQGTMAFAQLRPDTPRTNARGKLIKYETPQGVRMVLDVPPSARVDVTGSTFPLFITEGIKKADAAVEQGLCCLSLLGVWNWRGKAHADDAATAVLGDWESIRLQTRLVTIVFDSDVMTKPGVHAALVRLKAMLTSRGATVQVIYLPPGPDGAKVGLDDYFMAGGTRESLLTLATSTVHGGRVLEVISAADVPAETIEWLWPGRLAVGKLTNLVGPPDQGKDLILCDVAARLSRGDVMPPYPRHARHDAPGRVLILASEDGWGDTVVPRLTAAGADMTQIDFVRMVTDVQTGQSSLLTLQEDLAGLEAVLTRQRYHLLIINPLSGYLGHVKSHIDSEVRAVLTPVVDLLDRLRVAGLSVMHPPKDGSDILAYYAGGSVAFGAVPRVVLGVNVDPRDAAAPTPRRVLAKIKGNLFGVVPMLGYQITAERPDTAPWLEWAPEDVEGVTLVDLFRPARATNGGKVEDCRTWLRAYLADGAAHDADQGEADARSAGFSGWALKQARAGLVAATRDGGRYGRWVWTLLPAPPVDSPWPLGRWAPVPEGGA